MLKKRIICTLLWDQFGAVKGRGFKPDRRIGPMMQAIRVFERRQIDELIILDITATPQGRGPRFEEIKEFTSHLFCPLTVGGGVTCVEDAVGLLNAGADKVAICSADNATSAISEISQKIGKQSVVGAVDVRNGWAYKKCGTYKLYPADLWARILVHAGAGEILLTDIERDGTMQGYNLDLITRIAKEVNVPVIASGGCRDYDDMVAAIEAGADAVAAGALFQFTEATPKGAARHLNERGIPTRLQ